MSDTTDCLNRAERLEKVWGRILEALDRGLGLEYEDLLRIGEEAGLLRQVPFDPEKHSCSFENLEPGDPFFVPVEEAQDA